MNRAKGFTLVELLVVIAIIAMLLSMLMPALSKVRDQARLTIDKTNQRQIGLLMMAYASDNKDYLPQDRKSFDGGFCNTCTWSNTCLQPDNHVTGFGLLSPVYKADASQPVQKIFVCSADRDLAKWYNKKDRFGQYGEFYQVPLWLHKGAVSYSNFAKDVKTTLYDPKNGRVIIEQRNDDVGNRARHRTTCSQASNAALSMCNWKHGLKLAKDADSLQHPWWPQGIPSEKMPRENAAILFLDGHVVGCSFDKYAKNVKAQQPGWLSNGKLPWWTWARPQIQTTDGYIELVDSLSR